MQKRRAFWFLLVAFLGGVLFFLRHRLLQGLLGLPPPQTTAVRRQPLQIPMADGVRLAADHYQPLTHTPGPTILIRTPYDRTGFQQRLFATQFAQQGFQVIVQDTRGRFESEGRFQPRIFEQADGVETIAWIRRQPWSNGRVGMWGQSYVGYVQWAAATQAPPGLQAIVPTITTARGRGMFYSQGILSLEFVLRWLVIVDGMDPLDREKTPSRGHALRALPPFSDMFVGKLWDHLPLQELDQLAVGQKVDFYQDYLVHDPDDALFWGQVDFHDQLGQVAAAPHFISGWYDFMLNDFLADYEAFPQEKRPFLTIGPWHHFDFQGYLEMLRAGVDWFHAHLQDKPLRRTAPIKLFVMGADAWREFPQWPPPHREQQLYLQQNGSLLCTPPPESAGATAFLYDPADPTPSLGGTIFDMNNAGPADNRPLAARRDVLCFSSAPLSTPMTIIGRIHAALFVQTNGSQADFFARLCVEKADGRLINLCEGMARLQNEAEEMAELTVDMWATAYRFSRGERVVLLIAGGAHPRWARNPGHPASLGENRRLQPVLQTVFHDGGRPSALILPIIDENGAD